MIDFEIGEYIGLVLILVGITGLIACTIVDNYKDQRVIRSICEIVEPRTADYRKCLNSSLKEVLEKIPRTEEVKR